MPATGTCTDGQSVRDGDLGALQPGVDLRQWMLSEAEMTSEGPGDDDLIDDKGGGNPAGGIWVMHRNVINA